MTTEDERIASSIRKNGWHGIAVVDRPPPFCYSCGLMTTFNHAELIIFGLPPELGFAFLSEMYELIRKGQSFETDGTYAGVLDGEVAIRRVQPVYHNVYMGYAMGQRRILGAAGTLRAVQVLWPDAKGAFPFDKLCDPATKQVQPRLEGLPRV